MLDDSCRASRSSIMLHLICASCLMAVILALCASITVPSAAYAAPSTLMAGTVETLDAQADGSTAPSVAKVPVYRLYNPATGEHFYTESASERDALPAHGWIYEGIGWLAPSKSSQPVYRLNNPSGAHHYTTDAAERDNLIRHGWAYEGVGWYSVDSGPRAVLYREYNPHSSRGEHNFTTSVAENNNLVAHGWIHEGAAWSAYAEPSQLRDGWVYDGVWHYYKNGSPIANSWIVTDKPPACATAAGNQRYWIDRNGVLATGRYIDPKNAQDAGASYLAYATPGGNVVRGKYDTGAGRVILADDHGRLVEGSGWLITSKYDGEPQRYWIDGAKHAAVSGEFYVAGKMYWGLGGQGYVARNSFQCVNGVWFVADDDGVLTHDKIVDRLYGMAQGHWSPSRYMIMVDVDDPRTVVFEGSQGNWKIKYVWNCCTGKPSTPTRVGVFGIGAKGYSFGEGHGYSCYYYSQFSGDYLFHSRMYWAYTHNLREPQLGERISGGCVRLEDWAAIWIQENCPVGTRVVTTY